MTTMPFAGQKVTIQVQWIGGEGDNFENSLADFEAATGIDVVVDRVGSSHETVLRTRIEGNDASLNLAMLAQPSAVVAYGQEGKLVDVSSFMDAQQADRPSIRRQCRLSPMASRSGASRTRSTSSRPSGIPSRRSQNAGYSVPTTWDELLALLGPDRCRRQRQPVVRRHGGRHGNGLAGD